MRVLRVATAVQCILFAGRTTAIIRGKKNKQICIQTAKSQLKRYDHAKRINRAVFHLRRAWYIH